MSEVWAAGILDDPDAGGTDHIVLWVDQAHRIRAVAGGPSAASAVGRRLADVIPELAFVENQPAAARGCAQIQLGTLTVACSPLFSENGSLAGYCVTVRQTGDAAAAHLATRVQELEDELEAIFAASYDELYVTDPDGVTLRVGAATERLYGVRREQMLGRPVSDLVAEGFFDMVVTPRVVAERRTVTAVQMTNTGRQMLVTGSPVFNAAGQVVRVVTNSRDMTELIALQREVEQVKMQVSRYEAAHAQMVSDLLRGGIVAQSPAILKVLDAARRVANANVTVLVLGETGTGKNVIARHIHNLSPRARQCFVELNCAAIPDSLLESELFGYERGAFTGSRNQGKLGMLEAAASGTLVLDEIGELPINLQAKLLQFIQAGAFFRIGGVRPVKVDTRIIACTNRDLADMVAKGTFREDLFYRLNIVPIRLPPLRERREDIPMLTEHVVERLNQKYGVQRQLTSAAMARLMRYHWPGNVRQLEHVLEFVYIFCEHELVTLDDLPTDLLAAGSASHTVTPVSAVLAEGRSLDEVLDTVERTILENALEQAKSTRELSRVLGISQTSVVRKLHKHRLAARSIDDRTSTGSL